MINISTWLLIVIAVIMWCIGFVCGIKNDKFIIEDREHEINTYRKVLYEGKIPAVTTDSNGRRIYRCKRCNKRVYKTLRHCPSCGQKINWNFIISQEKKEEK